ncbi:MAG: toll/interleukin-1 receptor domain-containing protein, partial [Pyrinomonadaceae bacterium]
MIIFLSYSSKDRTLAEEIHLALLGGGHEVFFDKSSLPPGGDYNSRIRQAIKKSDAFVFLISPNSVRPGGYALTELSFAKEKWPKPWGVVLPVMLAPTDYSLIDKYLTAVTILEPKGNVAAEVAAAVDKLSPLSRRLRRFMLPAFILSLIIGLPLGWYFWPPPPPPSCSLTADQEK